MESGASLKQDMPESINSYDEVPYESKTYRETDPDLLATIATLFGMNPTPASRARILELGCASGGNLTPLACNLPDSQCLGIDLSQRQIADGKAQIESLGLKNIELKSMNILELDKSLGSFDYILVHGIFSWVPKEVQFKILSICQEMLTPNGLAFISYNAMPGWHFRTVIRDMMVYHTAPLKDPQARAQQARAFLNFLCQVVPALNNAYGIMLRSEAASLMGFSDDYILHDFLEEQNEPFYFAQFISLAAQYGLQYLGEPEFNVMLSSNFPKEIAETLGRISDNQIMRTEQYMDFIRNRPFRRNILCRKEQILNRNVSPQALMSLYIGCEATAVPEKSEVNSLEKQIFKMPNGNYLETAEPLAKAALQHLLGVFPAFVKFDDLLKIAEEKVDPDKRNTAEANRQILAQDLLTAYAFGVTHMRTEAAPLLSSVSERPKASELARLQAKSQGWVTSQLHDMISLDGIFRRLIEILDGRKNRDELIESMVKLVEQDQLVVQKNGKMLKEGQELRDLLGEQIDWGLAGFARKALLVG